MEETGFILSKKTLERIKRVVVAVERWILKNPGEPDLGQQAIQFYNDTDETIPPLSFMQISSYMQLDTGQFYYKVKKPINLTNIQCPLLISGLQEVEKNELGTAQSGPEFKIRTTDSTLSIGDRLGPENAKWTARLGAMYRVIGFDNVFGDDKVARCLFDTSTMYGKTKAGGLASGVDGFVYAYKADGTLTSKEYPARTKGSSIAGDTDVMMFSTQGVWAPMRYC